MREAAGAALQRIGKRAALAILVLSVQHTHMNNPPLLHAARLGALALLLSLGACSGVSANGNAPATPPSMPAGATPTPPAPTPAPAPTGQAPHLALWKQIQDEIGTAECDNASQCKTLPVGHKACGGPEGYVAYSTKSGNNARLLALAEQYAAARKDEVERSGMMSNCMVEPDPGASCVAKRCVLNRRGANPGSSVSVE